MPDDAPPTTIEAVSYRPRSKTRWTYAVISGETNWADNWILEDRKQAKFTHGIGVWNIVVGVGWVLGLGESRRLWHVGGGGWRRGVASC
jgi:hypothetical protein